MTTNVSGCFEPPAFRRREGKRARIPSPQGNAGLQNLIAARERGPKIRRDHAARARAKSGRVLVLVVIIIAVTRGPRPRISGPVDVLLFLFVLIVLCAMFVLLVLFILSSFCVGVGARHLDVASCFWLRRSLCVVGVAC